MNEAKEYLSLVNIAKKTSEASEGFDWKMLLEIPKELSHALKNANELAQTLGLMEQPAPEQHMQHTPQQHEKPYPGKITPKAPTQDALLSQASQMLNLILVTKGDVPISAVIAEIDKLRGANSEKQVVVEVSRETDSGSGAEGVGQNSAPEASPEATA